MSIVHSYRGSVPFAASTEPTNTIRGTSGDDHIRISKAPDVLGKMGYYVVVTDHKMYVMTKEQLEHTRCELGAGNDTLVVDPDVDANITAHGGSGDDLLIGGRGKDVFHGGSGDDRIDGGQGNDTLYGDGGNDTISGGPGLGKDRIFGGGGDDWLDGGRRKTYYGGLLQGSRGADVIQGGGGKDYINTAPSGSVDVELFRWATHLAQR